MSITTDNIMLEEGLQQLGLSAKEVSVYLSIAEIGKASAHSLAKRTGIARATVYFVLDQLEQRGLVGKEQKSSTTFYSAAAPSALRRMIEREQKAVQQKARLAEELVEAIQPYFKSTNYSVPRLRFYEGKEAVESMLYDNIESWRDSMKKLDFTWWGYEDKNFPDEYRSFFQWYWKRSYPREASGEKVRIFSDTPWAETAEKYFSDTIFKPVPKGYDFTTSIWILGEYIIVLMTRHEPHYAFQIFDPVFSRNIKVVFEMLWNLTPDQIAST